MRDRSDYFGLPDWIVALVATENEAGLIPCSSLLQRGGFENLFAQFEAEAPCSKAQHKARLSFWTQHYLACLCLPLAGISLLTQRPVDAAPERMGLRLNDQALPAAISLPRPLWSDRGRMLGSLMDAHLRPFIAAVSAYASLSPPVFWGNAAHYLEWLIGWLEDEGRLSASALTEARAFLDQPRLSDGARNPLCGAIRYAGGLRLPEKRRRKTCCLRYHIGRAEDCGALCPLTSGCHRDAA